MLINILKNFVEMVVSIVRKKEKLPNPQLDTNLKSNVNNMSNVKNLISVEEYLMGRATLETLPDETVRNINTLIPKVNDLLEAFYTTFPNEPKHDVSSGIRTKEDHIRIYEEINTKRKAKNLPALSIPWGSKHLTGAAVDIEDKTDKFKNWILLNVKMLEDLGLYCEAFSHTDTWVHIQCISPKSGNRFFVP